ncbi:uncharacterized protein LOC141613221 [Silene latifolia]|uniref:uncharacterized protein LOC141613221 n=1 Tax=Silene latifolia TaxID=37657 RepID=UPI003D77B169
MDCFAWSHNDMIRIDPSVITNKLSVDLGCKPIQQRRRKFAAETNKVINHEVDSLLAANKVREVKYPEWLSNVVVVPKKNGKWSQTRNANIPGHLEWLQRNQDGSSRSGEDIIHVRKGGYTAIMLCLRPEECRIYVSKIVKPDVQRTIRKNYGSYIVTQRGREANTEQIKAVLQLESPEKPKDVQRLAGKVVVLSRYDLKTTIKSQALAYLVSDFSPAIQNLADKEILALKGDKEAEVWQMHITGASNQRGARVGLILRSPHGDLIAKEVRSEFKATNNETEYKALILGMQLALEVGSQKPTEGRNLSNKPLRQAYFWPTMKEASASYAQKCDAFQRSAPMIHQPAEPLHPIISPGPFMVWGIDIVGPLPKGPGNRL